MWQPQIILPAIAKLTNLKKLKLRGIQAPFRGEHVVQLLVTCKRLRIFALDCTPLAVNFLYHLNYVLQSTLPVRFYICDSIQSYSALNYSLVFISPHTLFQYFGNIKTLHISTEHEVDIHFGEPPMCETARTILEYIDMYAGETHKPAFRLQLFDHVALQSSNIPIHILVESIVYWLETLVKEDSLLYRISPSFSPLDDDYDHKKSFLIHAGRAFVFLHLILNAGSCC